MDESQTENLRGQFREMGAHKVRALLARGYFPDDQILVAEDWLEAIEVARLDASNRPILLMARKAKIPAWTAAIAAIAAAIISTLAAVVAYLAWLYPRH